MAASEALEPLSNIKEYKDFFVPSELPGLEIDESTLVLNAPGGGELLRISDGQVHLSFYWFQRETATYEKSQGIENLIFDQDISIRELIYTKNKGYKFSYDVIIKRILDISSEVKTIEITSAIEEMTFVDTTKVRIPTGFFRDVRHDAALLYKKAKAYHKSTERFLINQSAEKYTKKSVRETTFLRQDEFDFLIHKLNIKTKKKKEDYIKYLSSGDISALQDLCMSLVNKEVFDGDFIRKLYNYFIREKLEDIIAIGQDILSLKSVDLGTPKAQKILTRLGLKKRQVKKLEGLWQIYFEKYLLYLIFTYREIYPKVKLRLDSGKKYPDFIGVNHYYGVDIIEIKTHLAPILSYDSSHKNYSFSSEMSKAIIQTMNYIDAVKQKRFKSPSEGRRVTETAFEENVYDPRGIIIISSYDRLTKKVKAGEDREFIKRDFTKLRGCLHGIEVLTFDEVIGVAKNYLEKVISHE